MYYFKAIKFDDSLLLPYAFTYTHVSGARNQGGIVIPPRSPPLKSGVEVWGYDVFSKPYSEYTECALTYRDYQNNNTHLQANYDLRNFKYSVGQNLLGRTFHGLLCFQLQVTPIFA